VNCDGFFRVSDIRGKGLTETFFEILENLSIPLSKCRGHSYDNGSNMKRRNIGTHTRIIRKNHRAHFGISCGHGVNVVVSDSAEP
jgi:hypothetical protein